VLTPEQLAALAGTCSVGLIPYALNDYTRGVSPLKCFEYLASGLAVLGTPLPAIQEVAAANDHVMAGDAARLPAMLLELMRPATDADIAARMASAAQHGWEGRGNVLRDLLATELARRV
jgi:hypothetical protein